jgi:hypothetical protein
VASAQPSPAHDLTARDLEWFAARGVTDRELLTRADIQRVTHQDAIDRCGIRYKSDHLEGIAFPNLDPQQPGRIRGWRVKRDNPEVGSDRAPIAKYVSPPERQHLYFVPGCNGALADPFRPSIIVEAATSGLAVTEAARAAGRSDPLVIATHGCWGWKGVTGKTGSPTGERVDEKGPLPDFDHVHWSGRDVVIAFDANVSTNEQVQRGQKGLAHELVRRGARVRLVTLPVEPGVNGPDDFIAKHGSQDFWRLVDAAKPFGARLRPDKAAKKEQGGEVRLDQPEPWPEPVDGPRVLDAIADTFTRYVALPDHANIALALWIVHCYAFSAFFTSPLLAITSPVKRCGKTLLLIVLGALVPRRLFASNVTPAVLFRTIEKFSPTLLIDEADTFIRDNDELRGVINSGHTRTTAVAIRAVGDDHDPRSFSTWCPKAIALIGKLPGTLADRSIEVHMRRRTAGEQVARLRQDRIEDDCRDIRRQAARWADDHASALQDADASVPPALHDRAADCWRPLLAIADCAGGRWPELARRAALALCDADDDEEITTLLLRDLRSIFSADGEPEAIFTKTLLERLVALDDRPWSEFGRSEKPLSAKKLAGLLKRYDVHPAGTIRIGGDTEKGYRREAFVDAWSRYVGTSTDLDPSHGNNFNKDGHELPFQSVTLGNGRDGSQKVTNPINTAGCYAVTDQHLREDDAGVF